MSDTTANPDSALALLTGHYAKQGIQSYIVPDVADSTGKPLTIWFKPPTNRDAERIRARAGASEAKITLYTVIYLALNEDGARMFEDKAPVVKALSEGVNGATLARMAAAIMTLTKADDLGN